MIFDNGLKFVRHVTHREEMYERGDEAHHQEHNGGEAVDAVTERQCGGRAGCTGSDPRPNHAVRPALGYALLFARRLGRGWNVNPADISLVMRTYPGNRVILQEENES